MRKWKEVVRGERYLKAVQQRGEKKLNMTRMAFAFEGWVEALRDDWMDNAENDRQSLQKRVQELEEEKARLERDNERFVRLIDSGQWGKGRVEEIVKAGEAMRKEREEMQSLLNQLRKDYDTLQKRRESQDEEINSLKERLMSGNFMQRNKMLVRGASQYNASNRAAKTRIASVSAFPDGDYRSQPTGARQPQQAPALSEEEVARLERRSRRHF